MAGAGRGNYIRWWFSQVKGAAGDDAAEICKLLADLMLPPCILSLIARFLEFYAQLIY
uniref:Uncharacterized protein n=1 Tax=Castor canadensis TaxID=51338 RepID=A0A8C0WBT1_CASCN